VARRPDIGLRLAQGERLLLDGATGSELQRRGISVSSRRPTGGRPELVAWSATAMIDAPEVVRAIHEDYLRVGSDIITCNSYNANRGMLALAGLANRSAELSRLAATLAIEARDKMNRQAYVAGSVAPTNRFPDGWDPGRVASSEDLARDWGEQSAVLADAGVDFILIETMSAIFQLLPAVDAARATGLPAFLGIHPTPEGTMTSGETLADLIAALKGREPDAILLMCRSPEDVSATLPNLRRAFDGPIGAYANIGYTKDPDPEGWQYHSIDIGDNTPGRYAHCCQTWLDMGAQIVGGCCGSTPEHIAAISSLVHSPVGKPVKSM
jgi:S-methylmethionine-dependent homocysteine/selenocysteine methylase